MMPPFHGLSNSRKFILIEVQKTVILALFLMQPCIEWVHQHTIFIFFLQTLCHRRVTFQCETSAHSKGGCHALETIFHTRQVNSCD
jgi:hypothetical protein